MTDPYLVYAFYTRDHLGSIREVTNSAGALQARYDYDPYGKRVTVTGEMDLDFGYAGYYYHAPSGLNLTLYRAYNPTLGRWLSRDPIGEMGGLNLYGYVESNPINVLDPDGLAAVTIRIPFSRHSFWFHIWLTSVLPGEWEHEQQHVNDYWNDPSMAGWLVEKRGFLAQVSFLERRISELKAKECLSESETAELVERENDVISYRIQATDAEAKRYWNDRVRWFFQKKEKIP